MKLKLYPRVVIVVTITTIYIVCSTVWYMSSSPSGVFLRDYDTEIHKISTLPEQYYEQERQLASYYDKNPAKFPFPAKFLNTPNYMTNIDTSYMRDNETQSELHQHPSAPLELRDLPWLFADDYPVMASANAGLMLSVPRTLRQVAYRYFRNGSEHSNIDPYLSVIQTPHDILLSYRAGPRNIKMIRSDIGNGLKFKPKIFNTLGEAAKWSKNKLQNSFCMTYDPVDPDPSRRIKVGYQFHQREGTDCSRLAFSKDLSNFTFPMATQSCCSGFLPDDCGTMADTLNCIFYSAPLNKYILINRKTYATPRYFRDIRGIRFSGIDSGTFYSMNKYRKHSHTCARRVYRFDIASGVQPCRAYNDKNNWHQLNAFAIRHPHGSATRHVTHIYSWGVTPYPNVTHPTIFIGLVTILKFPRITEHPSNQNTDAVFAPDTLHTYLSTSHDGVHWDLGWIYNGMEFAPGADGGVQAHQTGVQALTPPRSYFTADKFVTVGTRHFMYYIDYANHTHESKNSGTFDKSIRIAEIDRERFAGIVSASCRYPYCCSNGTESPDVMYMRYGSFAIAAITNKHAYSYIPDDTALVLSRPVILPRSHHHLKLNVQNINDNGRVFAYLLNYNGTVLSSAVTTTSGYRVPSITTPNDNLHQKYYIFFVLKCSVLYSMVFENG